MSTAGAQALRLDSSAVRSKVSLNRRLIWSCRVVTPLKGSHRAIVLMVVSTSIGDCVHIVRYESAFVKSKVKRPIHFNNIFIINEIQQQSQLGPVFRPTCPSRSE